MLREHSRRGTSLTPLAVLTGFALNLGTRAFLCSVGTAAMMSTNRGLDSSEYFDANRVLTRFCEHLGMRFKNDLTPL